MIKIILFRSVLRSVKQFNSLNTTPNYLLSLLQNIPGEVNDKQIKQLEKLAENLVKPTNIFQF